MPLSRASSRAVAMVCCLTLSQLLGCRADTPLGPTQPAADAPGLVFISSPGSPIPAGSVLAPIVQVAAVTRDGNTDASYTGLVSVAVSENAPPGTLSGSRSVQAVRGIALFPGLRMMTSGVGYTLTATAPARSSATSARFDVVRAAYLSFVPQLTGFVVGDPISPAIQVTAEDPEDPGHTFSGEVTITLGPNATGAVLSGVTRVHAVNGVATFDNLRIDKAGRDYILTASAAGFAAGASGVIASYVPALEFSVQPGLFVPNAPLTPALQVRARDGNGVTLTSFVGEVTVALGANPDCGILSGTTHVVAVSGIANFPDLRIDRAGGGCTLTATAAGMAGATSFPFGSNSALFFTVQPADGIAGFALPPVRVTVRNGAGNVDLLFGGSVTLALGSHPAGATLSGTTTVRVVNGVADFSDLGLSTAGTGYTLVASTAEPGVTGTISTPFAITASHWIPKAPPPSARSGAVGAVINGIFYLVGGYDQSSSYYYYPPASRTVEAYDPATNSWSTKAPMPSDRGNFGIGVVNGILYVVGGFDGSSNESATMDAYDPATNIWSPRQVMPTGRTGPGVGVVNGTLYAAGGYGHGQVLATVEAYDPATNSWSPRPALPTPLESPAVSGLNGKLYVVGGWTGQAYSKTMDAYDPAANIWSSRAPMLTARFNAGAAVLSDLLYVVGGSRSDGSSQGAVEAYDPATNSWQPGAPLPFGATTLAVGVVNEVLYAALGRQLFAYQP